MQRFVFGMILLWASVAAIAQTPETPAAAPAEDSKLIQMLNRAQAVIDGVAAQTISTDPGAAPAETGEALVLDADRCVERALKENAQAFVAEAKVAAAKAKIPQAESARYPQISSRAAFNYMGGLNSNVTDSLIGRLVIGDKLMGSKDIETVEINASQVIYAGGQIAAAIRAAEALAQSQEWQREVALDTLAFQSKQAYYDCLLANALAQVAQDSVTTFTRHVADAEHALEVGLIGNFEVLRAKTELGARESDLTAANNAERLALVNLRRLIAVPQTTQITFQETMAWRPLEGPVENLIKQALSHRAELLALEQAAEAARENLKRIEGQYRPKVAANAKYSKMNGAGNVMPDGLNVTVGAEWDIYTGGRRKAEVAGAKADIETLEYQLEDVRRLVELDVRQAFIQVENAVATIRSEKGTVDLGLEGRRLAELRFQEGVGTQGETLDAELALTAAETKLVQALRDYAVAQAALDKALGKRYAARVDDAAAQAADEAKPCEEAMAPSCDQGK